MIQWFLKWLVAYPPIEEYFKKLPIVNECLFAGLMNLLLQCGVALPARQKRGLIRDASPHVFSATLDSLVFVGH